MRCNILNDSNRLNVLSECESSTWQIAIRPLSRLSASLGWELLWAGSEWAPSSPCNEVTMEVSAAPRDTLRPLPLLASLYLIHGAPLLLALHVIIWCVSDTLYQEIHPYAGLTLINNSIVWQRKNKFFSGNESLLMMGERVIQLCYTGKIT